MPHSPPWTTTIWPHEEQTICPICGASCPQSEQQPRPKGSADVMSPSTTSPGPCRKRRLPPDYFSGRQDVHLFRRSPDAAVSQENGRRIELRQFRWVDYFDLALFDVLILLVKASSPSWWRDNPERVVAAQVSAMLSAFEYQVVHGGDAEKRIRRAGGRFDLGPAHLIIPRHRETWNIPKNLHLHSVLAAVRSTMRAPHFGHRFSGFSSAESTAE